MHCPNPHAIVAGYIKIPLLTTSKRSKTCAERGSIKSTDELKIDLHGIEQNFWLGTVPLAVEDRHLLHP